MCNLIQKPSHQPSIKTARRWPIVHNGRAQITTCFLLLAFAMLPHTVLAVSAADEEKVVVQTFIPINLKKDLPSFSASTYGCKKVPANDNGAGCLVDNDWSDFTYTAPTSSSGSGSSGSGSSGSSWSPGSSGGGV